MKDLRHEMDAAYGDIVRCLEAASILNPENTLTSFMNTLNSNVKRYNDVVAMRKGKKTKKPGEIIDIPAKVNEKDVNKDNLNPPDPFVDLPTKR
jgi:hypothetical protein